MNQHRTSQKKRSFLKRARIQKNWSQKDVADRLNISVITVNRWEQGVTAPSPYYRQLLCDLFEQTADQLGLFTETQKQLVASTIEETSYLSDPALPSLSKTASPLVGREAEIDQIVTQLCSGHVATYALTGLPGIGKTSLAIAIAHDPRIQEHFSHGILWAGVGASPHILSTLTRWGKMLGIPDTVAQELLTIDAWARYLHDALGNRRCLFILDDVWCESDAKHLLIGGSHCAHLLTTRLPAFAYQWAGQHVIRLHELSDQQSLALLHHYISPQLLQPHEETVQTLIRSVNGLPLALVLLGHHLNIQANGSFRRFAKALQHLQDDLPLRFQLNIPLDTWKQTPGVSIDANISLFATIHSSIQALSATEREALYSLAVFPPKPQAFSEEAALQISGTSEKTLDALVDTGLLEVNHTKRYQLHQSIVDYIRTQKDLSIAEVQLIEYGNTFLHKAKEQFFMLDQEWSLITYTLELAFNKGLYASALEGCLLFLPFIEVRRHYELAESLLDIAQVSAQHMHNQAHMAHVNWHRGKIWEIRGNFLQAQSMYVSALIFARQAKDEQRIAQALVSLAGMLIDTQPSPDIEQYLIEGLRTFETLEDHAPLSTIYRYLGEMADSLGEHQKAEQCYHQGLRLATQTQDWRTASTLLQNLGVSAHRKAEYTLAKRYYRQGLQYAKQEGDEQRQSALLMNLGMLAWHEQHSEEAIKLSQESLQLARKLEHVMRISSVLQNLGMMMRCTHQETQAEAYLHESLSLAHKIGHQWLISETSWEIGILYVQQLRFDEALELFRIVDEMGERIQAPLLKALAIFGQAQVAAKRKRYVQARQLAQASQNILLTLNNQTYLQELQQWQEKELLEGM